MDNQDIENLIKKSLMQLKEILERDTLKYNIFFPKYSSEKTRYSEQELKCLFLSNIYKSEFLYTVETPSKRAYRFKNKKPLVLWENKVSNDTYKSSMIDVSLYAGKKENLLSHIEFKHGTGYVFPIQKDFLKMICESDNVKKNYFVHYVEKANEDTKKAIFEKYRTAINSIKDLNGNICDIDQRWNKVEVFLFLDGLDELYHFPLSIIENNLEDYKESL